MIGYMTVGTNDLEKAGEFYDALFDGIGAQRFMADDHIIVWSTKPGEGMFSVIKPANGEPATPGNGVMAAITVKDLGVIESLHAKALSLGGSCEGEPGTRGDNGMCFGYVRDPEGNKLAFFSMPS